MSGSRSNRALVVREVSSPDDRALGRAHGLLRRTFPRGELVPLPEWRESLREREAGLWTDLDWHLLVAESERRLLGAVTGSYVGNVNVGLVGYVAVLREWRGRGIGDRLRRGLRAALVRDATRIRARPLRALIGEVHLDNPWLAHLVQTNGALALDFPYFQPPLHRATRPVELVLYVQPLEGRRGFVRSEEVRQLVYTVWRRIYRVDRPLSQPAFRRMLRALPPGRRVGPRLLVKPASAPSQRARGSLPGARRGRLQRSIA